MTASLDDLGAPEAGARLRHGTLRLRIGPFVVCVRSGIDAFAQWLQQLYGHYEVLAETGFSDFHIRIDPPSAARRWWRPQVQFSLDGDLPFKPLPLGQACPFFEWGLNWCIAQRAQQYLVIHAAVVERDGAAVLLPGLPGAGKSTLCAGLVARGWRLFSDELALLRPGEWRLDPFPRPISLKDASIDVIRTVAPEMRIGPPCHDTAKGTVAHVRVPDASVERAREPAVPGRVLFPAFERGAETARTIRAPEQAFDELIGCAFNYGVQGARGFEALADLVGRCPVFDLRYGDLEAGCAAVEALVDEDRATG